MVKIVLNLCKAACVSGLLRLRKRLVKSITYINLQIINLTCKLEAGII